MKITIKDIYNDISLLYKNIFHWNISKLIIFVWGIILGILSIVPFAIIFFIYSLLSGSNFFDFVNSWINGVFMTSIFGNILYLISLLFFTISYCFTFILLLNLYKGYFSGNNLSYFSNKYLDYKLYFRHILLSIFNLFILLVPVFIFILLIILLIYLFGGVDSVTNLVFSSSSNPFSILSLVLFIFLVISIYYILLFLIVYLPFSVLGTYINGNYKDLNNYNSYLNLNEEDKSNLKAINPYTYELLDLKYSGKDATDIKGLENKFYILSTLYSIFKIIFLFGVFSMFLTSFYKRNILIEEIEQKVEKDL